MVFFAGLLCNTTSILVALFTMAFTRYLVFKVIYINLSEGSYRETNTLLASNRAQSCRQNLKLHYLIIYLQTAWNIIIFDIKKESTRRSSIKWTKILFQDDMYYIANFKYLLKIRILSNNKCRKQILKFIRNT